MAKGARVDDRAWKRIAKTMRDMGIADAHVRVGVLATQGGLEQHDDESGLTLIEIAAIHEFGAPAAGIPERSFIRATALARARDIATVQRFVATKVVLQQMTPERALEILGAWLQTEIKKAITSGAGIPPPLAEATVAAKGSSRPLVDTGRLINSIQWQVYVTRAASEAGGA